jgi:hypothetical protein
MTEAIAVTIELRTTVTPEIGTVVARHNRSASRPRQIRNAA